MHCDLQNLQTKIRKFILFKEQSQVLKTDIKKLFVVYLYKDLFPIVLLNCSHEFIKKLCIFLNHSKQQNTDLQTWNDLKSREAKRKYQSIGNERK